MRETETETEAVSETETEAVSETETETVRETVTESEAETQIESRERETGARRHLDASCRLSHMTVCAAHIVCSSNKADSAKCTWWPQ